MQRRGKLVTEHPEPVATTWSLSFGKIEQANPAAAELLRLCAFLHPDGIPEEFFIEGASHLSPTLQTLADNLIALDEAMEILRAYSLLRRNPATKTLSIHRLVQAVLRDAMNDDQQRQRVEQAIRIVNHLFPYVEANTWLLCERYVLHAQTCASLITQWNITLPEASRLLNQTGSYYYARGQYTEAEPLLQRALAIYEQELGANHPDTVTMRNNYALLLQAMRGHR